MSDNVRFRPIEGLNIELTLEQTNSYEAVKWLVYGGRRTGRSYLISAVLFEKALKTGQSVHLFDHHPGAQYRVWPRNRNHRDRPIQNSTALASQLRGGWRFSPTPIEVRTSRRWCMDRAGSGADRSTPRDSPRGSSMA